MKACRGQGGFVWLGLYEPTPHELDQVRDAFGLHELAWTKVVTAGAPCSGEYRDPTTTTENWPSALATTNPRRD